MSLPPDTKLGPYQIVAPLGAGGMGEVYRAKDTRLDREVAVKVLPEALARDAERVQRFRREAKVLAALNHPNIAAIYGFEDHRLETGSTHFLVMELVEGDTLADRLASGPLPVEEALDIARHMAEALEAAHEKGIVHRDLKPGNVMIRADGTVKVLDFGLARAMTSDPTASGTTYDSPTITADFTRPGVVLGTAGYMSPEQARGKPIDKRTDIWSFGVVLYECLTGRRPFEGETTSDLVAQILEREPDWSVLPTSTPPLIQLLLRRCLAKDKKRRLRDIGDASVDIETAVNDPTSSGLLLAQGALTTRPRPRWRRPWSLTLMLGLGIIVGLAVSSTLRRSNPTSANTSYHFTVDLPPAHTITWGWRTGGLALNPQGTLLAFVADAQSRRQIFVHDLSAGVTRPVPGTERGRMPFFTPDGRWLAYSTGGKLMKVPVGGGPPEIVRDSGSEHVWLDDGSIVFLGNQRLTRVNTDGGEPQLVRDFSGSAIRTDDGAQAVWGVMDLEAVPGASYVLASVWGGTAVRDHGIVSISLMDGTLRSVVRQATDPKYVPPGYLFFLRGSSVLAAPFDADRGVVTGDAFAVVETVWIGAEADRSLSAISSSGTLAYVPGARRGPGRRLIRVTPDGKVEPLMEGTDAIVGWVSVSPDGDNVAVETMRQKRELRVFNLKRSLFSLVYDAGEAYNPTWMLDGKALVFQRCRPEDQSCQIVSKRIDAASDPDVIPVEATGDTVPDSVSSDGRFLVLTSWQDDNLLLHHLEKDGATEILVERPYRQWHARFAPDGEHFAFHSNETGRAEVFVGSLSDRAWALQVSRGGGGSPRWSDDGKYLYFIDDKGYMNRSEVDTSSSFEVSVPEPLFDLSTVSTPYVWHVYDVLPNGDFIMVEPAEWEKKPVRIHVVTNWVSTLSKDSTP